jgi:carboxylate-amine ligase
MIIVSEEGKRRKISEDILILMEHLTPIAKRLNGYEELLYLKRIIRNGSSAKRQRRVFRETGSMRALVDMLAEEFETGMPVVAPAKLEPQKAIDPYQNVASQCVA